MLEAPEEATGVYGDDEEEAPDVVVVFEYAGLYEGGGFGSSSIGPMGNGIASTMGMVPSVAPSEALASNTISGSSSLAPLSAVWVSCLTVIVGGFDFVV